MDSTPFPRCNRVPTSFPMILTSSSVTGLLPGLSSVTGPEVPLTTEGGGIDKLEPAEKVSKGAFELSAGSNPAKHGFREAR